MAAGRTSTLTERLPLDVRRKVEHDLAVQPPGLETYEAVYEHYGLKKYGVSLSALEREGLYRRLIARNAFARQIADELVAALGQARGNAALIRSRVFDLAQAETLTTGELLKLAVANKAAADTVISEEKWEAKKRQAEAVIRENQKLAETDPKAAWQKTVADLRGVYGLEVG